MTLEEIKKVFRYGWIAKDEDENWHWFSKEPEMIYDDDYEGYYFYGKDEILIGIIEGTEGISSVDSLIKVGEE